MLFSEVTWGTSGWMYPHTYPSIPVSSCNSCPLSKEHLGTFVLMLAQTQMALMGKNSPCA